MEGGVTLLILRWGEASKILGNTGLRGKIVCNVFSWCFIISTILIIIYITAVFCYDVKYDANRIYFSFTGAQKRIILQYRLRSIINTFSVVVYILKFNIFLNITGRVRKFIIYIQGWAWEFEYISFYWWKLLKRNLQLYYAFPS